MKRVIFGLISIMLIIGMVFMGCENGTTDNGTENEYDGFGVWLITQSDYTAIENANWEGQPKPTAISYISSISGNFTATFYEPENFNPDSVNDTTDGWWNIGTAYIQLEAVSGNYYVIIFPYKIHPDNFEWVWDKGKISGSDSTPSTLNMTTNPFEFTPSSFITF
jgi:hypothetical protein